MQNPKKLAVIALGKRNAGKSNTWYEIFGKKIRSGWKKLKLHNRKQYVYLQNASHEEANTEIEETLFVRNASFEEAGDEPENYFDSDNLPKIIFCSVQYVEKGIRTINWFKDNGYYLYIQWINPGFYGGKKYEDHLGFEKEFKPYGDFKKHTGKEKANRAKEIKEFVFDWLSN